MAKPTVETLIDQLNMSLGNLTAKANQLRIDSLVTEAEIRQIRSIKDHLVDITKANGRES